MKHIRTFLISAALSGTLFCPLLSNAASSQTTVESGLYEIASFTDGTLILELQTCTVTEEKEGTLQLYSGLDTNQQKFYIEALQPNAYRISTLTSGEALTAGIPDNFLDSGVTIDLQGESPDSASGLQEDKLYSAAVFPDVIDHAVDEKTVLSSSMNKTEADVKTTAESPIVHPQLWTFEQTDAGFFYIRSTAGKYLTVDSDYAHKGALVVLKSFTGDRNQKWRLKKTWASQAAPADTDLINPYAEDGAYRNFRLTLQFGEHAETLTAHDFSAWMIETEDHEMKLDRKAITSYVTGLAETYNTQGIPRQFTTSYGDTITLYKGNFGWKLDVEGTADLIIEAAQKGEYLVTDPKWSKRGVLFEAGNDIGDSYVEVDLTNQKVWLYVDGEQILETDCVTGTYGTDRQTPGGVYSVYYRQSPDVLDGPGYSSPVEYWMAFNGGIGLHDANWRYSFGGDIYKYDGSHGCVNLPTEAAAKIYEVAQIGFPVVCYN